jgi:hypothetical protein
MKMLLRWGWICLFFILLGCSKGKEKAPPPDNQSDYSSIQELRKHVVEEYKRLVSTMGEEKARQKIVEWVLAQEKVKSAGISEDGETIWIILKNGVEMNVIVK